MTLPEFQRARSPEAKQLRETAILEAARQLGAAQGIRRVTLGEIAEAIGMHKSALLRYFETREEIFLQLTAEGWHEWATALGAELERLTTPTPQTIAAAFAGTLAKRGMFCDLLAQAPLNLERNVSVDVVREFKVAVHADLETIVSALQRLLPGFSEVDAVDFIAAATSLSGAFWQMATPGAEVAALYRRDPQLAHAIVEVRPRVERLLTALLEGMRSTGREGTGHR